MKIKFSRLEYFFSALTVALMVYGWTFWGVEAMMTLKDWFKHAVKGTEVAKPAPPAGKAMPSAPLAAQIPLCRKQGPGFQACMYKAGYAVNSEWTTAHSKETDGTASAKDSARAMEVVSDPYKAGPSPVYGVPYWIPRP